jgi:hypothetical protein
MKTSEAFKLAKQRLSPTGRCTFICHALAEAAYDRRIMSSTFDWHAVYKTEKAGFKTAIKTVTDRIGSDTALENWLGARGIDVWGLDDKQEQMQAYRHRWLHALIAEFESKGD